MASVEDVLVTVAPVVPIVTMPATAVSSAPSVAVYARASENSPSYDTRNLPAHPPVQSHEKVWAIVKTSVPVVSEFL